MFKKHTSDSGGGRNGLVPVPNYNSNSKTRFLREDGTWVIPTNTTYAVVTSTANGLAPKIGTAASATIATQADEWVLTSTKGGTPTWRKLPINAFKNDNTNTTYTLSGGLSSNNYIGGIFGTCDFSSVKNCIFNGNITICFHIRII